MTGKNPHVEGDSLRFEVADQLQDLSLVSDQTGPQGLQGYVDKDVWL